MGETAKTGRGIGYWMERVVVECDKARKAFDADAVHDLRVAIRRCRSMGEGFQAVDGDPSWRKMRRAGKTVFSALGDLRDTQVLLEWIEKLKAASPPVAERLSAYCRQREAELKDAAAEVLAEFDTRRWLQWARVLEQRVQRLEGRPEVFQVLALERWQAARALHAQALRNRSKTAVHALRIGLKKLRYMVENFLPEQHAQWGDDLKSLQDLLGEVHDLDVLWDTARQIHAFASLQERQLWYAAVTRERKQRIQAYRDKMVGRNSLWQVWRSGLPSGEALQNAILQRFELWATSLDPDPAHTRTVAQFSLQLYDALAGRELLPRDGTGAAPPRNLLQVAAMAHEVGRMAGGKAHHKASRRMLQQLEVPPGWEETDLLIAGLVARYHRGALPAAQRTYAGLPAEKRGWVDCLSGILRLADSFDGEHDSSIRAFTVNQHNGAVEIVADGYQARSRHAEKIAAARLLLEDACATPIFLRATGSGLPA